MISSTYILSGVLLALSAWAFDANLLTALTQTILWSVVFFFASVEASTAYLTVSEIFPLEVRAKAIAVFFAIAQAFGALGPDIYGGLSKRSPPRCPPCQQRFRPAHWQPVPGPASATVGPRHTRSDRAGTLGRRYMVVRRPEPAPAPYHLMGMASGLEAGMSVAPCSARSAARSGMPVWLGTNEHPRQRPTRPVHGAQSAGLVSVLWFAPSMRYRRSEQRSEQ